MANTKISALSSDTAPTADDLVVTVNDPAGTPATKKATITNFTKAIPAVVGDSGSGGTKGLAPAPGAGDAAAGKYLDAAGGYSVPSGTGAPTNATYITQTANGTLSNEQALGALATGILKSTTTTGVVSIADVNDLASPVYAADGGSTDAYAITLSPAPSAYQTGALYRFKANTANTGACSLNVNSLGAKTIKKVAGGITTDLADNDIRVGQFVDCVYDGTNMQMQSTLGNAPSGGGGTDATTTWAFSGDITPTSISADQNNYNPTGLSTATVLRLKATSADRNLTGLQGGADGRLIIITNIGTPGTDFDVILKHESASSTDVNRFYNAGVLRGDVRVRPRQGVMLWYDTSEGTGRWKTLTGPINGDRLIAWLGDTSNPAFSFATKENYGFYHDANNCIPVVVNGTDKYGFNTSSFLVKAGQSLGFASGGLGATGCTAGFRSPASGQIATCDQDSDTIGATLYCPTRDAASSTLNLAQGHVQKFTLTTNTTFAAPSNRKDGIVLTLILIQDGTGSRTGTWNSVFKWVGGVAPTLTTAAGSKDIFQFWCDGTNLYEISRAMDVK